MGKIKKFAAVQIKKITGGKDPLRLVEEFIVRRGHDPEKCSKEKTPDNARWMIPLTDDEELEVLVEGLTRHPETTVYMGVNVATVPIRNSAEVLAAALEIADGLVGIKISLVGHYLVLSSSFPAAGVSLEELDYNYEIISVQQTWFREALADELGWETMPEE
ncbi:MAG: hypothetical protein SGJ02_06935 [bacterium]|nr:hypothetical protein [bacterium]